MRIIYRRNVLIAVVAIVVIAASFSGTIMSRVEQPSYTVVESLGDFELRDYPPLIVAEVKVPGERKQAINAGFRMIANYIFGNNAPREKIAMTAPVTQHPHDHSAFGRVSSANLSKHVRNHNFTLTCSVASHNHKVEIFV